MKEPDKNVFGERLEICSLKPLTGFFLEKDVAVPDPRMQERSPYVR
jgi:uncharacterized protein (DUF2237 family)